MLLILQNFSMILFAAFLDAIVQKACKTHLQFMHQNSKLDKKLLYNPYIGGFRNTPCDCSQWLLGNRMLQSSFPGKLPMLFTHVQCESE